jgi:hypothetical protein
VRPRERAAAPFVAVSVHANGVALGWAPAGEGCANGATFFGGTQHQDAAFGAYGKSAAELDRMLYELDAVSVWAAGNERMDAGPSGDAPHYHYPDCATEQHDAHADEASLVYGTLGGPISAKNAIAVAAVADVEVSDIAPERSPVSYAGPRTTSRWRSRRSSSSTKSKILDWRLKADISEQVADCASSAATANWGAAAKPGRGQPGGGLHSALLASLEVVSVETAQNVVIRFVGTGLRDCESSAFHRAATRADTFSTHSRTAGRSR